MDKIPSKKDENARSPRVCPTCGTSLGPSASRCVVCGTDLRSSTGRSASGGATQITLSIPLAIGLLAIFSLLAAGLTFLATQVIIESPDATPAESPTITSTETATPEPTASETAIPTLAPLPTLEYIIIEGDTCVGLAVRYDISLQSILQINPRLTTQCLLSVGQRVYLPQPTLTPSPEPTATLPPFEATQAACETIPYAVEANNTLSGIAINYNVDMFAIMDYNGLTSETVYVGQVLIIPLCERLPTPGPSPTNTPPPPLPAPNLLLPQDGAAFSLANDSVTLQWASVGVLRESEFYEVTIEDVTDGSGTLRIVDYVTDTKFIIPSSFRPQESVPHVMRWWIQVVRQVGTTEAGEPRFEPGGIISFKRDFTWSGAAPGVTPTP